MSESTRIHHYPFTFRSSALVAANMCAHRAFLYITPPEDAITIERLYCHFRMTFDSGTASVDRVVRSIGICNGLPLTFLKDPTIWRKVQLDQAADGSRKVDIRIDLSHLLVKANAKFRDGFNDPATGDLTYVMLELDYDLRDSLAVGIIDLWKLDALFTTKAIH